MHRFPKANRIQKDFKKRYFWFLQNGMFQVFVLSGYGVLGSLFVNISPEYQWTLALATPLVREAFTWLSLKLAYKSAGKGSEGKDSVKFPVQHYMATKYAVFLAIIVGNVATEVTSNLILIMDFIEQMYHGLKIVWKCKKRNQKVLGNY